MDWYNQKMADSLSVGHLSAQWHEEATKEEGERKKIRNENEIVRPQGRDDCSLNLLHATVSAVHG